MTKPTSPAAYFFYYLLLLLLLLDQGRICSSFAPTISIKASRFAHLCRDVEGGRSGFRRRQQQPQILKKEKQRERGRNILAAPLYASSSYFLSSMTGMAPKESLEFPAEKILEGTNLENAAASFGLERCYKASVDGWSAVDFHNKVDNRGSCLVVLLASNNKNGGRVFGGYNPLGWRSTDDYTSSNAAFLWFCTSSGSIKKCNILQGGNAAIFDYATGGPCFGAADLQIGPPQAAVMGGFAGPDMEDTSINAGSLKIGNSNLRGAYDYQSGWPVGGKFSLVEVEVYCNAQVKSNNNDSSGNGGPSWWPF